MKNILLAVLACSVLAGCNDSAENTGYICKDRESDYQMAISLTGFPESLEASGVKYHPFNLSPIESTDDVTDGVQYQFEYTKNTKDYGIYSSVFIITYKHPYLDAIKVLTSNKIKAPFAKKWKEAKDIISSDIRVTSMFSTTYTESGNSHNNDHFWMNCKTLKQARK